MDDSVQGYKVECNGNEAPCKESSCEGLHFQFTTSNREKLQYPNNICGGGPPLFGEQQPNLALHGDAFLGVLTGAERVQEGRLDLCPKRGCLDLLPFLARLSSSAYKPRGTPRNIL